MAEPAANGGGFTDALDALVAIAREVAGETVVYSRDARNLEASISGALPARYDSDQTETDAGGVDADLCDWILPPDAVDFGAGFTEPREGDELRVARGGDVVVFRVLTPRGSASCWRWTDATRRGLRVHAQETGIE